MAKETSTDIARNSRGAAVWTNLIAAVLLAALVGGGAFVTSKVLLIDSNSGFNYGNSDGSLGQFTWGTYIPAHSWNIGVTIVGTAVGILTSLAFTMQDDFMTRRALASDEGCPAMFLRPLTVKRGTQQIMRGMLSPERTLLFILMAATAIMSATTVAVFSIQQHAMDVLNPRASYPLQDFNTSFFVQGANHYSLAGSYGAGTGALGIFMYKSAYINALKAKGQYDTTFQWAAGSGLKYLDESGQIGYTAYPSLETGGIGLNVASYIHRTGDPVGFTLPPNRLYTLDSLEGDVYGTRVKATCKEVSSEYTVTDGNVEDVEVLFVTKPNGPNITMMWDDGFGKSYRSLTIGTDVWGISDVTSNPTLTVAVTGTVGSVWVAECTYSGHEYVTSMRLPSADSFIEFGPDEKQTLSDIGSKFKQDIANNTNLIMVQGMGGQLARGFIDAQYLNNGLNTTGLVPVLETVLSQVGEAYVSLLRQNYEYTNADPSPSSLQPDNQSFMNVRITVQRLGGASYGWLAVYGVFFLACLLGLARIYSRARTVAFEAQDAVKLLANVYDPDVNGRTRLRYENGLTIVTG